MASGYRVASPVQQGNPRLYMNSKLSPTPSFGAACWLWLRIGCLGFGGPAGQIALLQDEVVARRQWVSAQRFQHALDYCILLPGPEAQQLATYLGWLLHGTRGGVVAGTLFVLPGLIVITVLAWGYLRVGQTRMALELLSGIKPVVVAMVCAATWRMGRRAITTPMAGLIAVAACAASVSAAVPFPLVLLIAAVLGTLHHRTLAAAAPTEASGAAPSPLAPHLRRSRTRLLTTIAVVFALWVGAVASLWALTGPKGVLMDLALLMTQAALVTFGGAYAVLPYVIEAAVRQYGWITAPQAIDALAFGETTPGPLILILSFIGALAVVQSSPAALATPQLTIAVIAGAGVAAFFTFLPSFLFILAAGPWVEASRQLPRIRGPLSGIRAAVVGMIAALAFSFAGPVLLPSPPHPDWQAMAIAATALVALVRFQRGALETLIAGGAVAALSSLARHFIPAT